MQWGCHSNSPRGNSLYQIINNKKYSIQSPPNPTYWLTSPRKRPDILDIFITKIPKRLNCLTENLTNPMPDHSPVIRVVNAEPLIKSIRPSLINGLMNWDMFQSILINQINLKTRLKTDTDIDEAVDNLTTSIQSAAWCSCSPISTSSQNQYKIPIHIGQIIVQKRRARANWQRTRYPSDKRIFNNLCTKLKREAGHQRTGDFIKYTASLSEKKRLTLESYSQNSQTQTNHFSIKKAGWKLGDKWY
ncbi:Endonuclease/exonuclease/phosphatase [Cinara cedri]|uniref:Endonuclease/exonuclease/phosphatase n=1 Tax=Cinara cedri TaxID=506608 RepID=A0A5E4NBM3_9HEMI|nr:Endonuclease/exonuclease/phosphatase [Cinara cedri]